MCLFAQESWPETGITHLNQPFFPWLLAFPNHQRGCKLLFFQRDKVLFEQSRDCRGGAVDLGSVPRSGNLSRHSACGHLRRWPGWPGLEGGRVPAKKGSGKICFMSWRGLWGLAGWLAGTAWLVPKGFRFCLWAEPGKNGMLVHWNQLKELQLREEFLSRKHSLMAFANGFFLWEKGGRKPITFQLV